MNGAMSTKNIQDFFTRCKGLLEEGIGEWGLFAIVFLVALAAFGLGRLSALEGTRTGVSITEAPSLAHPRGMYRGGLYVASRGASSYYYPWCGGATRIAPENQVWFKTEAAAQKAGYTPAKNCKGLVSNPSEIQ